jgi:hypothetical protein
MAFNEKTAHPDEQPRLLAAAQNGEVYPLSTEDLISRVIRYYPLGVPAAPGGQYDTDRSTQNVTNCTPRRKKWL